ncbi:MAG: hypothetical protein ACRCX2_10255 [Paraclostridium sp.]
MFKLICDKCNNELKLENEFENINDVIEIIELRDGRILIVCKECDSEVVSD